MVAGWGLGGCLSPGVDTLELAELAVYLLVAARLDMAWVTFHWQELVVKYLEVVSELGRRSLPVRGC